MEWAASITPLSTSIKEDSTMRAINGAAENVSETMAAVGPKEVPTMVRVTGISMTINKRKGIERVTLTITSSTL